MPELQVILSGLVSFVPRKEKGKKFMSVVLPTAKEADEAVGLPGNAPRPPILAGHFPVLRFKEKYFSYETSPRQPDWVLHKPDDEAEFLIFLGQDEITVDTGLSTPAEYRRLQDPKYKALKRPNPDATDAEYRRQRRDFKWIPRMESARRGCGKVDPRFIDSPPARFSTRLTIVEGTLATFKLGGETPPFGENRKLDLYAFPGQEEGEAMTEEIEWLVPCASTVALHFEPLAGQDPDPDLHLSVVDGAIKSRIQNLELEGVLEPPPGKGTLKTNIAEDFLVFYELASAKPIRDEREVPRRVSTEGGGPAAPRICPTTRFKRA